MSDSKRAPAGLEELTTLMNEIAREFVAMNTDDPRRASLVKQFENLADIRMSIRSQIGELIGQRMDELTRETLRADEARRAQVVNEIESLRELLRIVNG